MFSSRQRLRKDTRKPIKNDFIRNKPTGGVWTLPAHRREKADFFIDRRGVKVFEVHNMKDYFKLLSDYEIKSSLKIDWERLFLDYDAVSVSDNVIKTLGRDQKSVKGPITSVFSEWGSGGILWRDRKTLDLAIREDPYSKRYGKLYSEFSKNMIGSIPLLGAKVSLPLYASPEIITEMGLGGERKKLKLLNDALTKIFKSNTVMSNLKRLSPQGVMRFNPQASLVSLGVNWVANYDSGFIELNLPNASVQKIGKKSLISNTLVCLGFAYFDQCLRPAERKYWKKWVKETGAVANLTKYAQLAPSTKNKYRDAFGLGWLAWVYPIETVYKNMVGEFLEGSPQTEDLFDINNPLGVELPKDRFKYFDLASVEDMKFDFTGDYENPTADKKSLSVYDFLDVTGASIMINGILDAIKKDPTLRAKYGSPDNFKIEASDLGLESTISDTKNGALFMSEIDVDIYLNGEQILKLHRILASNKKQGVVLDNESCFPHPDFKGLGLATKMMEGQVATALNLGIPKIHCFAGQGEFSQQRGDSVTEMTGYNVWWKYGYDGLISTVSFKNQPNHDMIKAYFRAAVSQNLEDLTERDARELFIALFDVALPQEFQAVLGDKYSSRDLQNKIIFNDYLNTPEGLVLFNKNDFEAFVRHHSVKRRIRDKLDEFFIKHGFSVKKMSIQALMQTSFNGVPFPTFWKEHGGGWKAKMDLSEGIRSMPVVILDMYRKAKAKQFGSDVFPRSRQASFDEYEVTKAFGMIPKEDVQLVAQIRKEVLQMFKTQAKRLASLWLGSHYGEE